MKSMVLVLALCGGAVSAQEGVGLSREECIDILHRTELAREEAEQLAEGMGFSVIEAYGPIPEEIEPGTPLVLATNSAWEAFAAALGDLCRDKL